jgi:hypothetical protein
MTSNMEVWYKIIIYKAPDYYLTTMYDVHPSNIIKANKNFNLRSWMANGIREVQGTRDRIEIEKYTANTKELIFKMEGE